MINFNIYRLCRDTETIARIQEQAKKYGLPNNICLSGIDYFQFLTKVLKDEKNDYALVCHDDIIVPLNVAEKINHAIENINKKYGDDTWGIAGNAGIEFPTNEMIRFIRDPHSNTIPYCSTSKIASFLDGNTLLLNLKNLRNKRFSLPSELGGFHFYDFATVIESYKSGLLSVIDPNLYVFHASAGDQLAFDKEGMQGKFPDYWVKNFVNHKVATINGPIEFKQSLDYLMKDKHDERTDYYQLIEKVMQKREIKTVTLAVIVRTQLKNLHHLRRNLKSISVLSALCGEGDIKVVISVNNSPLKRPNYQKTINSIKSDYSDLTLNIIESPSMVGGQSPRVYALKHAISALRGDEYVLILDEDDFVMPKGVTSAFRYLEEDELFIGDTAAFKEKWDEKVSNDFPKESLNIERFYNTHNYYQAIYSDNHVPICSCIYPANVLKEIFQEYNLLGDYYEDYTIFLIAINKINPHYFPILISGVSLHGENTVFEKDRSHWDYSLTTFMAEIVEKGLIKKWQHDIDLGYESTFRENNRLRLTIKKWTPFISPYRFVYRTLMKLKGLVKDD